VNAENTILQGMLTYHLRKHNFGRTVGTVVLEVFVNTTLVCELSISAGSKPLRDCASLSIMEGLSLRARPT
jgi:hypothetical protein